MTSAQPRGAPFRRRRPRCRPGRPPRRAAGAVLIGSVPRSADALPARRPALVLRRPAR